MSKIQDILDGISDEDITMTLHHEYGIEPLDALLLEDVINFKNREIPADFNVAIEEYRDFNQAERDAKKVYCPNCGSINVEEMVYAPLSYIREEYWHCNSCGFEFQKR